MEISDKDNNYRIIKNCLSYKDMRSHTFGIIIRMD